MEDVHYPAQNPVHEGSSETGLGKAGARLPFFKVSKVSKQELYFVKINYEIFSTEVSARENNVRTVVGHIRELLGLLEFHPPFGRFEFVRRLGSTGASMFYVAAFALSNSYFFRPLVKFP